MQEPPGTHPPGVSSSAGCIRPPVRSVGKGKGECLSVFLHLGGRKWEALTLKEKLNFCKQFNKEMKVRNDPPEILISSGSPQMALGFSISAL